jgi:polar amino acid transport system substrate-binding protein
MKERRGGHRQWKFVVAGIALLVSACAHEAGTRAQASPSPAIDRIRARGELVVGTAGSMPPLNMTTREGDVIGLDVDLAHLVAGGMGVRLKLQTMPFADLLPALREGRVDMVISSMTITPSRNLESAFVGPYFVSGKSLVTTKDVASSVTNAADLNSERMTLAALDGSTSAYFVEKLLPRARLVKTADYDEAVGLVLKGEAAALVADHPICQVTAYRHRDKGLVALKNQLTYEPLGIAVPPDDPLLLNFLENLLFRLEASKDLDKLRKRWFEDTDWLQRLP